MMRDSHHEIGGDSNALCGDCSPSGRLKEPLLWTRAWKLQTKAAHAPLTIPRLGSRSGKAISLSGGLSEIMPVSDRT